jgi:S-formylglutathione hydrolase
MKLVLAFCVALLLGSAPGDSFAARRAGGRIEEVQTPAPSLQGNLIGTSTFQTTAIYLPPSYGRGSRHYPVIYLLHGIANNHETWLNYIGIKAILDRSIAARRIPEVIVVMPDGFNVYGGGYYRNSSVSGRWEDFIADDLIHFVETHYRTINDAGGRALVGWSMGGFGALNIAMDRPGLYSAVYAISPCCLAPVEDLGPGNEAWPRTLALRSQAEVQTAAQRGDFYVVAIVGLLSAFDPAPEAPPLFVHFPYEMENGQLTPDPANYDRYTAQFPVNRIPSAPTGLAALRVLGMDYGVNDQFTHIPTATRMFSDGLAQARIPHRLDVYDGDHRQRVAERLEAVVLPFVAGALDPPH